MCDLNRPRPSKTFKANNSTAGYVSPMSFVLRLFANGEIMQLAFDNEKLEYYDYHIIMISLSLTILFWSP